MGSLFSKTSLEINYPKYHSWKPRPIADPMDPVEVGNRALFVTKEKSERITPKVENHFVNPQNDKGFNLMGNNVIDHIRKETILGVIEKDMEKRSVDVEGKKLDIPEKELAKISRRATLCAVRKVLNIWLRNPKLKKTK